VRENDSGPIEASFENPWLALPEDTWNDLRALASVRHYLRDEILYGPDSVLRNVYIVKKGRVRLGYFNADGEEKGAYIADENCMFGEAAAIPGYPTFYTATVIVDSDIYEIPAQALVKKLHQDPELSYKLILLLARKMRIYSKQEIVLSFSEAYGRTCSMLFFLADRYGIARTDLGPDAKEISVSFTQQEMANMINCSRVRVANVFSNLMRDGLLLKQRGHYIVLDLVKLKNTFAQL